MRAALSLGAATAAMMIGGCGQSEEQVLAELRHQMMQGCSGRMTPAVAGTPGFDVAAFCTCFTDKTLAGRSAAEARVLFADAEKRGAAARQAQAECQPADAPDLPPIELEVPRERATENKQKAAERPRRSEPAARPKGEPAPARPSAEGPIATPRPMPVPPAQNRATPAPPPGFGTPAPRGNAQAPRTTAQRP
jgi:hypothetical protein